MRRRICTFILVATSAYSVMSPLHTSAQSSVAVPMQDTFDAPSKGLAKQVQIDLEKAAFGTYSKEGEFTETSKVPLETGQAYGWKLKLKQLQPNAKIKWKEEFILPAAPKKWGGEDTNVSKDKTTNVTEREVEPTNGWIGHAWDVAEGDPPGKYVMKIYINDVLMKTFKFQVK